MVGNALARLIVPLFMDLYGSLIVAVLDVRFAF